MKFWDIIRRKTKKVVDRLLAERKSLLNSALVAVVEALRMNPDRYAVIYNSKYDDNNDDNIFDSSNNNTIVSISSPSSKSQNHYYNQYHEGILEISNSLLKILTNQIVDNTIVRAVKEQRT